MVLLRGSETKLVNADDAVRVLRDLLAAEDRIDQEKEHFYVIYLNTRSIIKAVELISLGTLNSAIAHPREVFRRAISEGACSILLAHNHPSEDTDPSDEDRIMTRTLFDAGRIVGIDVLDHIVFGFKRYFSFRDNITHSR